MTPSHSTEAVLTAALRIQAELPGLVGETALAQISPQLEQLIARMQAAQDDPQRRQLAYELVDVLVAQPETRQLFYQYQSQAAQPSDLSTDWDLAGELAAIAAEIGADQGAAAYILALANRYLRAPGLPESFRRRMIYLDEGGIGEAKSVKVKNLRLDIDQLSELAPGILLAATEKVLPAANPLLVTAGVLLIVRSLVKAMTVTIAEQEASVFWGLIQASDPERIASEPEIVRQTNAERHKIGLEALKPNQVKTALHRLQAIKAVEALTAPAGSWKLIEKYRVR